MKTMIIALMLVLALAVGLIANVQAIDAWERANGHPFGKLCDLYRSCR